MEALFQFLSSLQMFHLNNKILGLSTIELETFDNVLSLKTMYSLASQLSTHIYKHFHLGPNYNYISVELTLYR